jgi:hypothetical protein
VDNLSEHPFEQLRISEATALVPTSFERWADRAEAMLADVLHTDHLGRPSLDGTLWEDGYCLDEAFDLFELGWSVDEYAGYVRWSIENVNRF